MYNILHIQQVFRHCPCVMLWSLTYGKNNLATLKATLLSVLKHSGIVNGSYLLCLNHIGELQFFSLFYSDSPIPILGYLYSLCYQSKEDSRISLVTSICTHHWYQNDLIVFTVPLNLTKLNYLFRAKTLDSV